MMSLARGPRFASLCLAAASVVMSCLLGCQRDSLCDRMKRLRDMCHERVWENDERRRQGRPKWPPFTQGEVLAVLEEKPDLDMTVAEFKEMIQKPRVGTYSADMSKVMGVIEHFCRVTERLPRDENIDHFLSRFRIWVYYWKTPDKGYISVSWSWVRHGPYYFSHYYLFDPKGFLINFGGSFRRLFHKEFDNQEKPVMDRE